jgi:hypothetical protein
VLQIGKVLKASMAKTTQLSALLFSFPWRRRGQILCGAKEPGRYRMETLAELEQMSRTAQTIADPAAMLSR